MKIKTFLGILLFLTNLCFSQNALKSYQWRDHLAYNRALSVTTQSNKIYCAVTTVDPGNDPYYKQTLQGLFCFNKNDNSYSRLSKVSGLSDVDPVIVKNNQYNNSLFIAYANGNIDIIANGVITNMSDLLRKQILGNKTINSVSFSNQFAYLATGFGILVINTDTYEVQDTYIIGPNGSNMNVYEVTLDNTNIYAATTGGVYFAPLNSNNLANYQNWQKFSALPNGPYNTIVNFGGQIYTNFSKNILSGANLQDTIYMFNGSNWTPYPYKPHDIYGYNIKKLFADNVHNRLVIIDQVSFEIRDNSGIVYTRTWGFNGLTYSNIVDVILDPSEANTYWVADKLNGLIKCKADNSASSVNPNLYHIYAPNGPNTFLSNEIKIVNNKVLVAPVSLGGAATPSYFREGAYIFDGGTWRHVKKKLGTYFDINCIAVDTSNNNHFFVGSYGSGLLEFLNDSAINVFDNTNSSIHSAISSTPGDLRVTSVFLDKDNNLWTGVGFTNYMVSVKKAVDNTWTSLDFSAFYPTGAHTRGVFMDKNKQVWIRIENDGLLVYKHDGSFATPNSSNTKKLSTAVGSGGLPTIDVACVNEDKDGAIWIGTSAGVAVFYNPETIFTQSNGWDAQQIFIQQDGATQILLGTETINCIAVDGANNKWIGTAKSGLFCFSHDGQKLLYHFTAENSPLFSDNVLNIAINGNTGEIFIATDKGMQSFQNTTIDGFDTFQGVYSYPNPVKPSYNGPILIRGMISGAIVKITDIAGNLVYETTSEGGQAIWYAKNFKGERVTSGVYFVMCATSNGSDKTITKILVLN